MPAMRRLAAFLLLCAWSCATGAGDSDVDGGSSASGTGTGASGSPASGAGGDASSSANGAGGAAQTASSSSTAQSSSSKSAASSIASSSAIASSAASSGSGGASGDPWFKIEYTSSSQPTSPSWTFSSTPAYSSKDWAYQGKNWPEVWDVFNSIEVKNDPMGAWAAIIDTGDTFQVMLGMGKLKSVQDVEVVLEGRGYSSSSSGKFDVYNPLNNCGTSVTMAHDWSIHVAKVSLGACMIPGNTTQAIRIKPTVNGVALARMKVTLVGASY